MGTDPVASHGLPDGHGKTRRVAVNQSCRATVGKPDLAEPLLAAVDRLTITERRALEAYLRETKKRAPVTDAILDAAGVLPVDDRHTAALVVKRITRSGPAAYGLERVPDARQVRRSLRGK